MVEYAPQKGKYTKISSATISILEAMVIVGL